MTALTKDVQRRSLAGTTRQPLPVKANAKIFVGSIVALDASQLAIPADTTAGLKVAGIARTGLDNTGGANGVLGASPARFVEVERGVIYSFAANGTPKAGLPAYVVDDNTVTSVAGNVFAGVFFEPDPDNANNWFVYVPGISGPAAAQAAAIADLTLAYTANGPSITPDGAVTIADGSTPTDAEVLEFLEELHAKQIAILDALRDVGIISN